MMRRRRHKTRWEVQPLNRPGRKSLHGLVPLIVLSVLLSGLGFAYIWQGHRLQQLTAATDEARKALEAAQAVNRVLSLRIEEAFALERIARIARDRLGMTEPTPADIRYVQRPSTAAH